MKNNKKIKKAFTLIEVLIIVIIGAISMPPLIEMLRRINKESSTILPFVRTNNLVVDMLEEIKGKKWDENWIGGPLADADKTPAGSLGPESGEVSGAIRTSFDDMDDYKILQNVVPADERGNPLTLYAGFRITVNVYYVSGLKSLPPDFITPVTAVSNTKRIDVEVKKGTASFKASTVVCNY